MPTITPVTVPLSEPTDPTVGLLLLHAPPPTPSVSVVFAPTQTADAPEIAVGDKLTVTTIFDAQPAGDVYVILLVPVATPVITPLEGPTVAIEGLPLNHVPPVGLGISVIVAVTHTAVGPVSVGVGFTVIAFVAEHPVIPTV